MTANPPLVRASPRANISSRPLSLFFFIAGREGRESTLQDVILRMFLRPPSLSRSCGQETFRRSDLGGGLRAAATQSSTYSAAVAGPGIHSPMLALMPQPQTSPSRSFVCRHMIGQCSLSRMNMTLGQRKVLRSRAPRLPGISQRLLPRSRAALAC
jgi:hypothetical protein